MYRIVRMSSQALRYWPCAYQIVGPGLVICEWDGCHFLMALVLMLDLLCCTHSVLRSRLLACGSALD